MGSCRLDGVILLWPTRIDGLGVREEFGIEMRIAVRAEEAVTGLYRDRRFSARLRNFVWCDSNTNQGGESIGPWSA
jgi:hypothetical protein